MPSLRSLRRMVCYMSPGPVLPLTLMTPHQGGGGTQRMALALNSFFSSQVSQGGGSTGYLRIRYCFCAVCALFSVVGFLFSFCLATTTAAQSGAIAGLGTAFITKPLLYEVLKEYTVTVFICYCLCSFITRSTNSSGLRTGVQIMALEQSWRSVYNGHPPLWEPSSWWLGFLVSACFPYLVCIVGPVSLPGVYGGFTLHSLCRPGVNLQRFLCILQEQGFFW